MKIIQANSFYYLKGGAEKYMLDVCDWLTTHGHEVIPFAMRHTENKPSEFDKYFPSFVQTEKVELGFFGIKGLKTFGRMVYSLEARRKLSTLIYEQRPDLCHLHNIYNQLSPSILHTLSDKKVPVVMTVHDHHLVSPQYNIWAEGCGESHQNSGIAKATLSRFHKHSMIASFGQVFTYKFHRFMKLYRDYIDIFICPSQYMKAQLVRGGYPLEKIRTNPYGFDTRTVEPCYESDGYFLYVGRLSEEKGVETIIHAAKLLPGTKFKIVGHGPQINYLHKLAYGMENVEFLGFRVGDELMRLYQRAAAVLLPSRVHENFPLITLEAMAAGKPVIASEVGGVPEVVEDRVTGFLVKPIDIQGWVEAIMRIDLDDALREKMSRASRYVVEKRFSVEDHYRRLLQIYEEVMR